MRKKILVTGTDPDQYKDQGDVIHQPLIKLEPVAFHMPDLRAYDWLIFTSRFAVETFLRQVKGQLPKVAAIGKLTALALGVSGVKVDLVPEDESSTGLIDAFKGFDLTGRNILIPSSDLAREELPGGLRQLGAKVDRLIVYKNIKTKIEPIDLSGIDEVIFSSPSTVRNFMSEYGRLPQRVRPVFKGEVTKNEFAKYQA